MGGRSRDRLRWKEPMHSLEVELQRDFGLSPVASKALVLRMGELLDSYLSEFAEARGPGQISYPAVAIGERAGKPIRHCLTIPVKLTVLHESDVEVLHDAGRPALRRVRLARLCEESFRQGAVLSHEDLSLILSVDTSTVRRLANDCAEEGSRPPTRGMVQDIGPGESHKRQVIDLYFGGLLPAHIAARIGHSLGSVERYLADFARTVHLDHQGLPPEAIIRITGMRRRLVGIYLGLLRKYERSEHRPVIDRLLSRFGPVESEEVCDG